MSQPDLNSYEFAGNKIRLVQVSDRHLEGLRRILNDPVTMSELQFIATIPGGCSLDDMRERVNGWKRRRESGRSLHLVVLCAATDEVAGWCGFHEIVQEHQRAEFGVVLDVSAWGRGAGVECTLGVLEFGFESLMLHRVEMNTLETNTRAIKLATRIGAVPEGIRREYLLYEGRFLTEVRFGMLAREWPSAKERMRDLLARWAAEGLRSS